MRYSCRAIIGHGQACEPNYQCDACAAKQKYIPRIEKLEAALRRIIDRAEYRMGHHVTDAVCAIAREALEETK